MQTPLVCLTAPSQADLTSPETAQDSSPEAAVGAFPSSDETSVLSHLSGASHSSSDVSKEAQALYPVFNKTKKSLKTQAQLKVKLKKHLPAFSKSKKPLGVKSEMKQSLLLEYLAPGCPKERGEEHQ